MKSLKCKIYYTAVRDYAKADEKISFLRDSKLNDLSFRHIIPDQNNNWINSQLENNFKDFLPLADKVTKNAKSYEKHKAVFRLYTNGVNTARDEWVYSEAIEPLKNKIKHFVEKFNQVIDKTIGLKKEETEKKLDYSIKWSNALKISAFNSRRLSYSDKFVVKSLYRPFVSKYYYSDKFLSDRLTANHHKIFGDKLTKENRIITFPGSGSSNIFTVLASKYIADFHFNGDCQCLALYFYNTNNERNDNITDWGLEQFQMYYNAPKITKENIFHYTYAVLYNPHYLQKYELNLKREFPRLPLYQDFYQWVNWGEQLIDLHINYEAVAHYSLKRLDLPIPENSKRAPKSQLKADKTKGIIILDDVTTLEGIPKEAWDYKLGNRSALEWILDQYKEKKPKDPTIAAKFNTYRFTDYKERVIDLLQRVCTVSVETMRIIQSMPNE